MTTDRAPDWRALLATAQRAGIAVRVVAQPSPAAQALGVVAEYQPRPASITVYRSEVRRLARARGVAPRVVLAAALAHELAHHTEPPGLGRSAAEALARRAAKQGVV